MFRIPETKGNARKNFRVVDNDKDVARPWDSVLGFSGRHTMGTSDHSRTRQSTSASSWSSLSAEFWQRYADPDFPEPEDELFSAGEPSAYQMMLASTLTKYAAARQVSSRVNRQTAVRRLVERSKIKGRIDSEGKTHVDVPEETVSQALLADAEYNVARLLVNAQPVLTELWPSCWSPNTGL